MSPIFVNFIICFTLSSTATSKIIAYIAEEDDEEAPAIFQHLDVSQMYHSRKLGVEEVIVNQNFVLEGTYSSKFPHSISKADLLISICKTEEGRELVMKASQESGIPTIHIIRSSWTLTNDKIIGEAFRNQIFLVPTFTVFNNVILDVLPSLDISPNTKVLFERAYGPYPLFVLVDLEQRETTKKKIKLVTSHQGIILGKCNLRGFSLLLKVHNGRHEIQIFGAPGDKAFVQAAISSPAGNIENVKEVFGQLPVSMNFVNIEEAPYKRQEQLKSVAELGRAIIVAETASAVMLVRELSEIAEESPNLIVLTKDITPFRCEDCKSMNLSWIRPYATGSPNMRYLRDFIDDEFGLEFNYSTKGSKEVEIAFYFDVMNLVFKTLRNKTNRPNDTLPLKSTDVIYVFEDVAGVLNDTVPQYGGYKQLGATTFYENILAKVIRIERTSDHPEETYNKEIASWTILDKLTLIYDSLDIDIKAMETYRIATAVNFIQAVFQQKPFIQLSEDPDRPFEGYCIDLIELIREELNFTYTIYRVEDGSFGVVDQNGNWDGLIGALMSGMADIALAPLSVTAERENVIDFTVPYYDLVGESILMRKLEVKQSLFKFMQVLEWPVWVCIVAAYIVMSIALWLFDRISPYSYTNNKKKYDDVEKRAFTFKECLWFCMTSLTPQGGGEAPNNLSGRLAAGTWWLFGSIMIASYTANLAAFLTVSRMEQRITSLDDLGKQYRIRYAPRKGGLAEKYFRQMAEIEKRFYKIWKDMSLNQSLSPMDRARLAVWDYPIDNKYTNMWRFMQESRLPSSYEEAIQRVRDPAEDFAFIGDATEVKYAAFTDCQLEQIGTEFLRRPLAIAVQSGHILKDRMSSAILKLLNQRKLETLKEKWWNNNPNKAICEYTSNESDGISIRNIGGVFIVILAGIVLSVITLCIEYFYQRKSSVHIVDHIDVEEKKEANGAASLASVRYHNNFSSSVNHNNHVTSFAADNAGFQY